MPTQTDAASVARIARQWATGKRAAAFEALINTSDTRSAAELALEVYGRLREHHGAATAEAFRRRVRR